MLAVQLQQAQTDSQARSCSELTRSKQYIKRITALQQLLSPDVCFILEKIKIKQLQHAYTMHSCKQIDQLYLNLVHSVKYSLQRLIRQNQDLIKNSVNKDDLASQQQDLRNLLTSIDQLQQELCEVDRKLLNANELLLKKSHASLISMDDVDIDINLNNNNCEVTMKHSCTNPDFALENLVSCQKTIDSLNEEKKSLVFLLEHKQKKSKQIQQSLNFQRTHGFLKRMIDKSPQSQFELIYISFVQAKIKSQRV